MDSRNEDNNNQNEELLKQKHQCTKNCIEKTQIIDAIDFVKYMLVILPPSSLLLHTTTPFPLASFTFSQALNFFARQKLNIVDIAT